MLVILSILIFALATLLVRWLFKRLQEGRPPRYSDYEDRLARYRRSHPESLEKEQEQIRQWLDRAAAKQQQELPGNVDHASHAENVRLAQALYELKEDARTAFMRHPAATEADFRRCWPGIREEILKQHALEELAADPLLSLALAKEASEATQTRLSTEDLHGPNLHLLKRSADSEPH